MTYNSESELALRSRVQELEELVERLGDENDDLRYEMDRAQNNINSKDDEIKGLVGLVKQYQHISGTEEGSYCRVCNKTTTLGREYHRPDCCRLAFERRYG